MLSTSSSRPNDRIASPGFIPLRESLMHRNVRWYPRLLFMALSAMLVGGVAIAQQASQVGTLDGHTDLVYAVSWSPDGKTLATAGFDNTVRLWDAATRKEIRQYDGHTKIVMAVAISPDGKRILSGGNDNTAKVWDYPSADAIPKEKGKGKEKAKAPAGAAKTFTGHAGAIYSVAWNPDGKLAATGAADKTARFWDPTKGTQVRSIPAHATTVYAVAFNPKGDVLATGGDDMLIKYWNVADGKELRKSQGHGDSVYSVAFHPDGSKLASGSVDKTIRIWNVADGKELHKLDGHPDDIYAVAYSRDGRRLASVGSAGYLFVWDPNEVKPLFHQRIAPRTYTYGLSWSPDGSQIAVAASDNKAYILKMP
jgi:WD40 repeat protein